MERLFDSINDKIEELEQLVMQSDLEMMNSAELVELCTAAAELITLYEQNEKDLDGMFGKEVGVEIERLKFCAVVIKRAVPYLERAEIELGSVDDDLPEILDDLKQATDVEMMGESNPRETSYFDRNIGH